MGLRFIFMLTRNDKTVEDAETHLKTGAGRRRAPYRFQGCGAAVRTVERSERCNPGRWRDQLSGSGLA